MAIQSLAAQFNEDMEALHFSLNSQGPLPLANIRLLGSTVLRKWITEQGLSRLARELGVNLLLPAINTDNIFRAVSEAADCDYLMTGGVPIDGYPVSLIYVSSSPSTTLPLYGVLEARMTWMKPAAFQAQKRVWFEGVAITTNDLIKYAANKMGGIHHDGRLDGIFLTIDRARERFLFGSDKLNAGSSYQDIAHQHYLIISDNTPVPWDCVSVEIITACRSLMYCMADGRLVWTKLRGGEAEVCSYVANWHPGTPSVKGSEEMIQLSPMRT